MIVTRLRPAGPSQLYQTVLSDGTVNQFVYSGSEDDPMFSHWVEISRRRAQRSSDYMRAQRG